MRKRERVNRRHRRSIDGPRIDVFEYIGRFHNPRMRHRPGAADRKYSALTRLPVKTGQNLPNTATRGKRHA